MNRKKKTPPKEETRELLWTQIRFVVVEYKKPSDTFPTTYRGIQNDARKCLFLKEAIEECRRLRALKRSKDFGVIKRTRKRFAAPERRWGPPYKEEIVEEHFENV